MTKGPYPREQQSIFDIVEPRVELPEKLYFKIGEVCDLTGVKQHVLRYWEKEFSIIRPFRGPSKQRLYRRKDVETLLEIKKLLQDEGYTIAGARKYLGRGKRSGKDRVDAGGVKAVITPPVDQPARKTGKAVKTEGRQIQGQQGGNQNLLGWIKSELKALLVIFERRG